MNLKSYKRFFEEITIRGNTGVPGEGTDRSGRYLSDSETRAKTRIGLTNRDNPNLLGREIMELVGRSSQLIVGKEKELEDLAKEVILSEYGTILDGVHLDIKLVRPGQVQLDPDEDEDGDNEMPSYRLLNDPEIKKEVDKAKLLNNVIQGEAKNTKHILHTDIVKDGLERIFGKEPSKEIFNIWDRISKIADKLDWIIPIDAKAHMMEENPQGMAGSVKVDWKPKKKPDEDLTDKILKSLENGDDIKDSEEDISELMNDTEPSIKARGVDFPMLLHETVKGIYELIAAHSILDDEELARKVKLNVSSFADEAEDFRYGPEIAIDLRDFINSVINEKSKSNRSIGEYENLREFVFGKMVDRNYLNTDDFLNLFRGILSKSNDAKIKIGSIIDDIVGDLNEFDRENAPDIDDLIRQSADKPKLAGVPADKSDSAPEIKDVKRSKRDIQSDIDQALDDGDFDKVKSLAGEMEKWYPEK